MMMKKVSLGILLILAYASLQSAFAPPRCPKYHCADLTVKNACMLVEGDSSSMTYKLQPCQNESEICDMYGPFDELKYCIPFSSTPTLYPGEYCVDNSQCLSNLCGIVEKGEDKVCIGHNAEDSCTKDEDCNPGLYCNGSICKHLAEVGEACNSQQPCTVTAVCDLGHCVQIGQKANDKDAEVPAACSTFYIRDGKCAKGPVLDSKTFTCPEAGNCTYLLSEPDENFTEPCTCGMSEHSEGYCMPGRGDIEMRDVQFFALTKENSTYSMRPAQR